jgi:Uma2 family endonuclease
MSQLLAKRAFTVSEYHRMAEVGILKEDDRVELIEGEVIQMSPIGSRHAACVNRLNAILSQANPQGFIVSVQNPLTVDDFSEPEPDLALLHVKADYYQGDHPRPSDVILLVEVADSTLEFDRGTKLPLYARNKIPAVILVNLPGNLLEFHSEPAGNEYRSVRMFRAGESFNFAGVRFEVSKILS